MSDAEISEEALASLCSKLEHHGFDEVPPLLRALRAWAEGAEAQLRAARKVLGHTTDALLAAEARAEALQQQLWREGSNDAPDLLERAEAVCQLVWLDAPQEKIAAAVEVWQEGRACPPAAIGGTP